MRKRILMCIMVIATAVAFMPTSAFAAGKTVKMTTYNVYKTGSTAYCAGDSGIYKVKVKNGKVMSKKRLVKSEAHSYIYSLKKKGNYLYFSNGTEGTVTYICRVKTTGGKVKVLACVNEMFGFAIKGKKIYYSYCDWDEKNDTEKEACKVMNLNGKGKKSTNVRPYNKARTSNVKGYSVKSKTKGAYVRDYLKTPKRTYYLGKSKKYD